MHIRARSLLPDSLAIPNALSVQRNGTAATAIVRDWNADLHDGLRAKLDAKLDAELELEQLTLEDIFLELHR